MEVISGAMTLAMINMACEIVLLGLCPAWFVCLVLGNRRRMVFIHLVLGGLTLWLHFGTVTGTASAMIAFLISFPALFIAKHLIFGYVSKERINVNASNVYRLKGFITDELLMEVNKGRQGTVNIPIFHRRLMPYKKTDVFSIHLPLKMETK